MSAFVQICRWQFMHVSVGGMPAKEDFSTEVWQYRQSIPSPATWWSWLNGTGCLSTTPWRVAYDERIRVEKIQAKNARKKTAPKMLTFAIVFVLRWKICMDQTPPRTPRDDDIRRLPGLQGTL